MARLEVKVELELDGGSYPECTSDLEELTPGHVLRDIVTDVRIVHAR